MRYLIAQLALLTSITSISGCSPWPVQGQGGLGERFPHTLSPVEFKQPLKSEHGQRFELELTTRHLDTLVLEGANYCFPAAVHQARLHENRILRELLGGLNFDATSDLLIQRKLLSNLENQLDAAKKEKACLPPNTMIVEKTNHKQPHTFNLKHLVSLLNGDNQFAHNSFQLNPKYVNNLMKAAIIFNQQTNYRLHLEGHADITGKETRNMILAKKRAETVANLLQNLGINKTLMTISYKGSAEPLVVGSAPHIRLTNRRVMISVNIIDSIASVRK